ncbi:hypothetical protein, partial [Sphingopyxis sp. H100]
TPTPTPTPTPPSVTPAAGCPTISGGSLTDSGTINNPSIGSFRVCTLPSVITGSTTLPKIAGLVYRINGRVDVGSDQGPTEETSDPADVVLTIEPGVILYGESGPSWLNVNRGNRISAVGTPTRPIIFTSRDNIQGLNTENSSGQWGGVVLSGRSQITDCASGTATPGTNACERQTEGAVDPALYGGVLNNDNSGRMSYVQIRFSGYILSGNSELQSLTLQAIGSATQIDHIMSYNSSDDALEVFGGHAHVKHLIGIGAEDDNLDTDVGAKANFQYGIIVQRPNVGDAMIEADTDNAFDGNTPRQNTRVANFVFYQNSQNASADQASMLLRGGTDYGVYNSVLVSPNNPCLRISRTQTASGTQDAAIDEFGAPIFRSVLMQCSSTKYIDSGITAGATAAIFGTGTNGNNDAYTPTLTSLYINGATETAVTPFNVSTLNGQTFNSIELTRAGFFDQTTYIGAVKDATDTWFQGWTCNSATANFGTGNTGLCTSLPTF